VESALAKLALVVFAVVACSVVVEVLARLWLGHVAEPRAFNRYASVRQLQARYGEFGRRYTGSHLPHRYLGYTLKPAEEARGHNTLGFRGDEVSVPKPSGVTRIVCVGGSTTYGPRDHRASYPHLLQEVLRERGLENVEVVNAGVSSYTSHESLINVALRVVDLEPDVMIVYHGINDVHARLVWPSSEYRGDNSGARTATLRSLRMPSVLEYSTALRWLLIRLGWTEPHSELKQTVITEAPSYRAGAFVRQQAEGTYPDQVFRETPAREMLRRNGPVFFERNLKSMVAVARAHGAQVVLATFAFSAHFPDEPTVSSPEYRGALDEGNEVVRRVGVATGAPVFDFAAVMPDEPRYFTDGRHFTAEGNRLRATMFADFLLARALLPRPEP
jgi:lysophospholipase L1-like esterase